VQRDEAHVGERLVHQGADPRQQVEHILRRDHQLLVPRPTASGHEAGEAALVVPALRVAHRERADARPQADGGRRHRGRVDAAADQASQRHVADEAQPHRLVDPRADPLDPFPRARRRVRLEAQVPVAGDRSLVVAGHERLARRELPYPPDHGVGVGNEVEGQIARESVGIELPADRGMREQRAQLGAPHQPAARLRVVERLFTHAVAGEQKLLAPPIP